MLGLTSRAFVVAAAFAVAQPPSRDARLGEPRRSESGGAELSPAAAFDHTYASYRDILARFVHDARVNYRGLAANRALLDRVVDDIGRVPASEEATWARAERLAFWINAYNLLTLRSIVNHYPIRGSIFSLGPRNSIRQIDGVWTSTEWAAAGRQVTLDRIEHQILRPTFKDPRVHVAINCASKSCPPLGSEPYVGRVIDHQLDDAAERFLASDQGLQLSRGRLLVSSIFKWYGDDFAADAAVPGGATRGDLDAAIRRFVARYAPAAAADAARANAAVRFLPYDWSLNDVDR